MSKLDSVHGTIPRRFPQRRVGTKTHKDLGPEQPTAIERLLGYIPLPYGISCLLFVALLGGLFLTIARLQPGIGVPEIVANLILVPIMTLVILFGVRYLRRRLLAAEPALAPLLPGGVAAFHRAFGRVSSFWPQLALALGLGALTLLLTAPTLAGLGFFLSVVFASVIIVLAFAISSLIWVYGTSLLGMYKIGREPLKFPPFTKDPFLGVRPLGTLALSFSLVYFAALGPLVVLGPLSIFPELRSPVSFALALGFLFLGVGLFLAPLSSIHVKMRAEGQRQRQILRGRLSSVLELSGDPQTESDSEVLQKIRDLLTLETLERQAATIASWPFDTRILGTLAAVVLTVVAILVARVVTIGLGI